MFRTFTIGLLLMAGAACLAFMFLFWWCLVWIRHGLWCLAEPWRSGWDAEVYWGPGNFCWRALVIHLGRRLDARDFEISSRITFELVLGRHHCSLMDFGGHPLLPMPRWVRWRYADAYHARSTRREVWACLWTGRPWEFTGIDWPVRFYVI